MSIFDSPTMEKYQEKSIRKYYDCEKKVILMPENEFVVNPNGIGYLLYKTMVENSDKIAQVDALTGESENYSSFLQRCVRAAIHMRTLGIKPGDVITICSENNMNHHVPYVAAFLIGAVTACLDPTLSEEDTVYLLGLVKPKILFVSERAQVLIEKACSNIVDDIEICVFGNFQFAEFVDKKFGEEAFEVYKCQDLKETAAILFSSGTTGMPKGICWSHELMIYQCFNTPCPFGALFTTLYWASSNYNSLHHFLSGKTILICRDFNPTRLLEQIETYKIENLMLSVTDVLLFIRNFPEDHKTNLKHLVTGGSCMSEESLKKLIKALPTTQIHFAYGQTELFGIFAPNTNREHKIGSVGTPIKGKSYKVVDTETGKNVGFNQRGELLIRSRWCMTGYYQQTTDAWDEENYLKTGDEVYYDEDFHFYIVDRIKEMFKYKSWHIVPAKLERILLQHPGVVLGVIVGIPHPEDDNHVLAIAQMSNENTDSPDEVKNFVNARLGERDQIRVGVRFVNTIPLSPSGKYKRNVLRDMYVRGEI